MTEFEKRPGPGVVITAPGEDDTSEDFYTPPDGVDPLTAGYADYGLRDPDFFVRDPRFMFRVTPYLAFLTPGGAASFTLHILARTGPLHLIAKAELLKSGIGLSGEGALAFDLDTRMVARYEFSASADASTAFDRYPISITVGEDQWIGAEQSIQVIADVVSRRPHIPELVKDPLVQ